MPRLLWLLVYGLVAVAQTAAAASISPADFDIDAQLIEFDSVSGALSGAEFDPGLTLRSGSAVEPDADKVPGNFVVTETEFPGAMASPPNKITGALSTGEGCKFCSIIIEFDSPRTQVGFWVADPDFGQYADFFGPSGLLGTLSVTTHDSGSPFFIGFEDAGGITQVEVHSVTWLGLGIDNLMLSRAAVPEPSSAVLLVTLPSGKRYALLGDLVWQREGVSEREERPWLQRTLADADASAVREALLHVAAIAARFPNLVLVPAHDARGYADMPELPGMPARRPAD